jgi:16S rRNA (cytidine1402-2'-O)-methyltransferase
LSELAKHYDNSETPRGEIVLLIDRQRDATVREIENADIEALVTKLESEGLDRRSALKRAARELGVSRDEAYRRLTAARRR